VVGGSQIESIVRDGFLTLIAGTSVAVWYWRKSEYKNKGKIVKEDSTQKVEFYTIPIAMSVFALYLLLFVMRLIIFIDMYAEKPFLLMLEFPIIAIVAIVLFIPFIMKKISFDDDDDEDDNARES
jgi:cobalamin synthase